MEEINIAVSKGWVKTVQFLCEKSKRENKKTKFFMPVRPFVSSIDQRKRSIYFDYDIYGYSEYVLDKSISRLSKFKPKSCIQITTTHKLASKTLEQRYITDLISKKNMRVSIPLAPLTLASISRDVPWPFPSDPTQRVRCVVASDLHTLGY